MTWEMDAAASEATKGLCISLSDSPACLAPIGGPNRSIQSPDRAGIQEQEGRLLPLPVPSLCFP